MKPSAKFLAQIAVGTLAGTLLSISGLMSLMFYGANNGCFSWVDNIFGTQGYESCGSLGFIGGLILGALLGILAIRRSRLSNKTYKRIWIYTLLAAVLIPAGMALGTLPNDEYIFVPKIIGIFVGLALLLTLTFSASIHIISSLLGKR